MPGTGLRHKPNKVIGITGNIACGKSAAAAYLKSLGYTVVDADDISRLVVEPGTYTLDLIVKEFGSEILSSDGTLNRGALRKIIFDDVAKRKKLESILHPAIIQESKHQWDDAFLKGEKTVFYEAALIIETGRYKELDGTLLITALEEEQKSRLLQRDALTEQDALRIMASQMPQSEKEKYATWVVRNNGTLAELHNELDKFLDVIIKGDQSS